LRGRGSETEESLQARVDKSSYEMTFKKHFENVIINKDFETACVEAENIVLAFLNKE
jgi:guanylate kinase